MRCRCCSTEALVIGKLRLGLLPGYYCYTGGSNSLGTLRDAQMWA